MRIAVAVSGLTVAHRFDIAEAFTLYNVVNGIIVECQTFPYPQLEQAEIAAFFKNFEVAAVICNTISINDAREYCARDIEVVASVTGDARTAVEQYLTRTLIGADELCRCGDDDEDEEAEVSCYL